MTAPLAEAVIRARRHGVTTFGLPAHGFGAGVDRTVLEALGREVFAADVFSPKGVDDRAETGAYIDQAQALAAEAWGAEDCRFSTGGSTQAIQSALIATCRPGDTLILPSGEHKAVITMIVAMGLRPVFVMPSVDDRLGAEHGVTVLGVRAALAAHPEASAVLINSPSYFGTCPDVAGIAEAVHAAGLPLIVDEAWGAHFAFSAELPTHALAAGADITVTSLHKTMGVLAQGAAMFRQGGRVSRARFEAAWDTLQSSSHSTPIMASIDGARAAYEADGERLVAEAIEQGDRVRAAGRAAGLDVLDHDLIDGDAVAAIDRTKVAFGTAPWGATGIEVDDWIDREFGIYLGLSDVGRIEAGLGPGRTERGVARLCDAIAAAARHDGWHGAPTDTPGYDELTVTMACLPNEAATAPARTVPLARAAGEVCAEPVVPYPPGVARLLPGQRVEPVHVAFLTSQRRVGALVKGQADADLGTLRVVA